MNLVSLATHTVDLDRLPDKPRVLDVGCRGFDFAEAILAARPAAHVIAMDPDPAVNLRGDARILFLRMALVHDDRISSGYCAFSEGHGNFLCEYEQRNKERVRQECSGWEITGHQLHLVDCTNMTVLSRFFDVNRWDLVKLDCEGAEFDILEHWPGPIADQISVEFHDWTGPMEAARDEYYARVFPKLEAMGYEIVRHELCHLGAPEQKQLGHWDSLIALRR